MNTGGCLHGLQRLEQADFPHVRFGNQFFTGQLRAPLITGHDQLAVRQALDKLWALGHRRIGHITSVPGNPDDCMFMNFFQTRQTVCPPAWTVHLNFSITPRRWRERHGEHIIRGFLEKNRELTAIIVQNGIVCFDVVQQALASGRQLPEDLSIISLRDRLGLDLLQPAVSSFHLPVATISRRCAVEMLQVLKDGLPHRERVSRTEFTFIERASLAPAAAPLNSSAPRKPVSVKIEHSIDHMQNR
jgi:DNA-binding LacI/PurR family transcriptional regulator